MLKYFVIFCAGISILNFSNSCDFFSFKYEGMNCQVYYSQLSALTSLVCSNVGRTNITLYNACSTCFASAITMNQNQPSLAQLSICANMYLAGTNYTECAMILGNNTVALAGMQTTGCVTGYCNFVQCARRVNSNLLVANCYNDVLATNNATTDVERVSLYKNVTSCILARSRCNPVNPITGMTQNNRFITTTTTCFGKTTQVSNLSNTLQITATGDLQVVAFSAATIIQPQFCSTQVGWTQAGFTNVTCL